MEYNSQLENYYSRLKEVLEVTGKLTADDLHYCKLLTENESKNYFVQAGVSGSAFDFEMELYKLINRYADAGLKKPDLVSKMEYVTQSCRVS